MALYSCRLFLAFYSQKDAMQWIRREHLHASQQSIILNLSMIARSPIIFRYRTCSADSYIGFQCIPIQAYSQRIHSSFCISIPHAIVYSRSAACWRLLHISALQAVACHMIFWSLVSTSWVVRLLKHTFCVLVLVEVARLHKSLTHTTSTTEEEHLCYPLGAHLFCRLRNLNFEFSCRYL